MYGGTGLGLAICHRLAELMNGALSVVSTLGHGSTFSFTVDLPIADVATQTSFKLAHAHAPQNQVSAQHDIAPLANHGEVINILIVDDHPVNRMLLKQQLHLLGVQVEVAVDGNEALQRYQAQAFDLIITDCHMPEMDGYELTFRIREQERAMASRRLPIIAWTANVLVEEEEHCRAAGMDDLLTKPTELTDLRAMLLRWLIRAGVLSNET
jgi:CheY-like chemotaxis protein